MQRAIDLALNAKGRTSPNPIVGSVLVYKGEIISEGYHAYAGGPHAEVNCLNGADLSPYNKNELYLYVTLEPCAHYGKTPPCCDLVLEKGIHNIIIGQEDPNPKVAGGSIQRLINEGKNVVVGVLEEACKALNPVFLCNQNHQRPYVVLKWAQTQDGFVARENYDSKWISNSLSRKMVHQLRAELDGVLVGKNTVKYDNPSLTTRDWGGEHPVRIIMDPNLELTDSLTVFDHEVPCVVFNDLKSEVQRNIEWIQMNFKALNVELLLNELYQRGICSILVEGGSRTLNDFISSGCWDKAYVFESQQKFEKGIKAPLMNEVVNEALYLGGDKLSVYVN